MFGPGSPRASKFSAGNLWVFVFVSGSLKVSGLVGGFLKVFMAITGFPKFPGFASDTTKVFVFIAGNRKAHPLLQHHPASTFPVLVPGAISCM